MLDPGLREVQAVNGWMLLQLSGEGPPLSLDLDRHVAYAGPVVLDHPEYDCLAVRGQHGWFDAPMSYFHTHGGLHFGSSMADRWQTVRLQRESTATGAYGLAVDPSAAQELVMVASQAMGSVEAQVALHAHGGSLKILESGKSWCIVEPGGFDSGQYQLDPESVDASDLTWTRRAEHGVLVRVSTNADVTGLSLRGPIGEVEAPPAADGTVDLAFCSRTPGEWSLYIASLNRDSAWNFTAMIMDADLALGQCNDRWEPAGGSMR